LPPLQEALAKALLPTVKTWAMSVPAVVVMDEVVAKKRGLVECNSGA
jgi:hypothetical protein